MNKTKQNKTKQNKTKQNKQNKQKKTKKQKVKQNKINKLSGGDDYNLDSLKKDFNYYGLLNYISWEKGREYSVLLKEDDECAQINDCEKCSGDCKCLIKKDGKSKCVSTNRIKTFSINSTITHKLFDNTEQEFKIIYDEKILCITKNNIESNDTFYIRTIILENAITKSYFFLFSYGENFELEFNDNNKKLLLKFIKIIQVNCSNNEYNLHLYGHSMGSTMIRYLLYFINELNYKEIIIRLSGVRFTKEKIKILKPLNYKSLNLCLREEKDEEYPDDYERYLIDRYDKNSEQDNNQNIYGIEDILKNDTYIGIITSKEKETNFTIKNINEINNLKTGDNSNSIKIEGLMGNNFLHQLDNIQKFISGSNIVIPS